MCLDVIAVAINLVFMTFLDWLVKVNWLMLCAPPMHYSQVVAFLGHFQ